MAHPRCDRRWFGTDGTARNLPCPSALISILCSSGCGIAVPDDPDKTLQELRQRIATEGLPTLSAEALRISNGDKRPQSQAGAAERL